MIQFSVRKLASVSFLVAGHALCTSEAWSQSACSTAKLDEIFAQAADAKGKRNVIIDCNVTDNVLGTYDPAGSKKITKKLSFSGSDASGVRFSCGGREVEGQIYNDFAAVSVAHKADASTGDCLVPSNIKITNCAVHGRIIIGTPGKDEECTGLTSAIFDPKKTPTPQTADYFTNKIQENAPTDIHLQSIKLVQQYSEPWPKDNDPKNDDHDTKGGISVYFGWGVTNSSLTNSTIETEAAIPVDQNGLGTPVYIAPESSFIVVKDNVFSTAKGQQISIDGASHNLISNNNFAIKAASNSSAIGIFRNCGEGGGVRVQKPWQNHIINNYFTFSSGILNKMIEVAPRMKAINGAIYNERDFAAGCIIGQNERTWCAYSDQYDKPPNWNLYAWPVIDSEGKTSTQWAIGSGVDDGDNAKYTVFAQNQILNIAPEERIRSPNVLDVQSLPFYTYSNEQISGSHVAGTQCSSQCRKAGCAIDFFATKRHTFIKSGANAVELLEDQSQARRYQCSNGLLNPTAAGAASRQPFTVITPSNAEQVTQIVSCNNGKYIAGIRMACNLETVDYADVSTTPWNTMKIARASDVVSDGACSILAEDEAKLERSEKGSVSISRFTATHKSVTVHCHENDNSSSGECTISGELLCL